MNTKLPPNKHVHCKAHMNCPQCNDKGLSVASLHQREFIISEKKGEFSGAGLGLGLNGVSLGVGLGAYEENGTNTTKRAMIFSEPRPPEQISEGASLNFLSNLCLNLLLLLALFQASEFLGFTNSCVILRKLHPNAIENCR